MPSGYGRWSASNDGGGGGGVLMGVVALALLAVAAWLVLRLLADVFWAFLGLVVTAGAGLLAVAVATGRRYGSWRPAERSRIRSAPVRRSLPHPSPGRAIEGRVLEDAEWTMKMLGGRRVR